MDEAEGCLPKALCCQNEAAEFRRGQPAQQTGQYQRVEYIEDGHNLGVQTGIYVFRALRAHNIVKKDDDIHNI